MKVLLGPVHELHSGIHGALVEHPPQGVEFVGSPYELCFLHEALVGDFSPLRDPAVAEWVRFKNTAELIHSARLPVETSRPWVVDADSLLGPLQIGLFRALGAAESHDGLPDTEAIRRRERLMTNLYLTSQCGAIMLRTARAKQELFEHISERAILDPRSREALSAKTHVLPPVAAVNPIARRDRTSAPTVLYMGRTFSDKGGAIAVAVFSELQARHDKACRLVFVGPCPATAAAALRSIGVELHPVIPRSEYLKLLVDSDIFLSPSSFESFGMALLEAATAGVAIVCSAGPGMEHIEEFLRPGVDALTVSNSLPAAERIREYVCAVDELVRNHPRRTAMGNHNREQALKRARQHDRHLIQIYEHALSLETQQPSELPIPKDALVISTWSGVMCQWQRDRLAWSLGARVQL